MEPVILFEDYYLLVIHKPAGLSTESGSASHPSAEKWAMQYLLQQKREKTGEKAPKQPYIRAAHRLDRPASGILVFAKNKSVLTDLMGQFERRETEKTYWAATRQALPHSTATLAHWLKRDDTGKKALVFDQETTGAQLSSLTYTVIPATQENVFGELLPEKGEIEQPFWLKIALHTGRFHQIRAQLAHIGCPIIGDVQYGGPEWKPNAIQLCAKHLTFRHPKSGEEMGIGV